MDPQNSDEPLRDEDMQRQLRLNTVAMLKRTGGKISDEGGAAQQLGLKPTTLASRWRKWNIDPRDYKPKPMPS